MLREECHLGAWLVQGPGGSDSESKEQQTFADSRNLESRAVGSDRPQLSRPGATLGFPCATPTLGQILIFFPCVDQGSYSLVPGTRQEGEEALWPAQHGTSHFLVCGGQGWPLTDGSLDLSLW